MLAKLTCMNRDGRERVHAIVQDRVYVLGRGDRVDIRVPDNSVSRSHCILEKKGEAFTILDLTSSNGTLLNGKRLGDHNNLKDGDEILIGETRFFFKIVPEAERWALLTEVPDENEYDPSRPGQRFHVWQDPEEPVRDSSVIPTETGSFETRMIELSPEVKSRLQAARESGKAAEAATVGGSPAEEDLGGSFGQEDAAPTAGGERTAADVERELASGDEDAEGVGSFEMDEVPAKSGIGRTAADVERELAAGGEADEKEEESDEPVPAPGARTAEDMMLALATDGDEGPAPDVAPPAKEPAKPGAKAAVPPSPARPPAAAPKPAGDEDEFGAAPAGDPEEEALSRHCVELGYLDEDKVSLARMQREMDAADKPLGMYLVDRKLISWEQLKELLRLQEGGASQATQDEEAEKRWTKRESVLFGKFAVKKEFIAPEQLEECLAEQSTAMPRRNIGEILIAKGHMTKSQVDAVLKAQQREVLRCSSCDAAYLIRNLEPGRRLKCKTCGTILTVPPLPLDRKKLDDLKLPE